MKRFLRPRMMLVLLGSILFTCCQAFGATFSGKVFCPNNNPLPGAEVCVYSVDMSEQQGMVTARLVGKSTADTKGEFKIVAETPPGSSQENAIFCIAWKKDYSYSWAMSMGDQDAVHEFHLCYSKSISGRIVDSQEKPVADARIRAMVLTIPVKDPQTQMPNMLMNIDPMPFFTAASDSEGRFEIKDFPDLASMEFLITKPGMGTILTAPADINPSTALQYEVGRKDIVFTMKKGLTVSGKVLDAQDKPIPDATVTILPKGFPVNLLTKPVKTDSIGFYRFTDLAAGEYRIVMQGASGENGSETIDLQQDTSVPLKAKKGSLVRVKVMDEAEKPVEKANVTLYQNGQMPIGGQTNAQGVFEKELPAGTYSVQIYKSGIMNRTKQSEITVEEDKSCETIISLAGSTKVTGLVTDAKGKPIAGVEVKVLPNQGYPQATIKTDAKGRYTISWSPEDSSYTQGRFLMVAVNRSSKEGIAVDIDSETKEMNLQLKPTIAITGKVADEKGKPIARATVSVQIGTGNWYSQMDNKSIQTDSGGRYMLDCLPADTKYYIGVTGPTGFGTASIQPEEPMDGSTLKIEAKDTVLKVADKSVSGKVVDADGKAIEDAQINCYGEGQPNSNTKSDKDGKFTLNPVCEGFVEINVNYNKQNQWMYSNISAQAGDTEVEIVLTPEGNSGRRAVAKPKPLIDKPLTLGLSDPNQFGGKPLLICVWDYQQRPSRYVVKELSKKAGLFDDRQITVVLLQGQPMDKAVIDGWLKESNIGFVSDIIVGDADKIRFDLGVQGLPWLILTDKEHKVLAEGFDINEINAVLEKFK